VTGRFAPTPSGPLHAGSVAAAVASYLFAKSSGGRWLIRVEDLDRTREVPGCAGRYVADLAALGLVSDGEILRQSENVARYDSIFQDLRERDLVYGCGCSRREIASSASAPHGPEGPRYPGTCRDRALGKRQIRAWRLRVPPGIVEFRDRVFGEIRQDVSRTIGDFIVCRESPERTYAYQLAVVADDAFQGVTQVVRGADLLDSTPRQIVLLRMLGVPVPEYAHIPVFVERGGAKLSKRSGAGRIARAIAAGRAAEVLAVVLRALGQAETLERAVPLFDADRIPRDREIPTPPYFDDVASM